ncbi:deoxyribose-phosphate aldolase [uncultured Parolsenella sp.]|uniref:deoxyribose-phosphate aldolase n=1 Tax=uncultured Parolsenella sp. TaxID=2083008 RepID=UPI0025E7475A|nr:deoxyribose-phosphate aldolase [uncultured Parolsenella sp.]
MGKCYTLDDLARLVDHTNLHADATEADMEKLCEEARRYHFKMVAINSGQSARCAALLAGTDIHVGAAISFPLGQTSITAKVFETQDAIANGATEIDYVVNLTEVKAGNWDYVANEMRQVVAVCREASEGLEEAIPCKVIFENCLLTEDEKLGLCQVASEVKPDYVKTSTGFSTGGATVADVKLMREHVPAEVQVKAAGGIRDADTFLDMVRAGATRIGCSAGIPIIDELRRRFEERGIDSIEL